MYRQLLDWGKQNITKEDVAGKTVIEVGAKDHNGSFKDMIVEFGPASYVGIDIEPGKNVTVIMDATELMEFYPPESFQIVVCTEVLEHVHGWRSVITGMKMILEPGGILLFSIPAPDFAKHDYPFDYWRWEREDLEEMFSDMEILALDTITIDENQHGYALKVRKPPDWSPADLTHTNPKEIGKCQIKTPQNSGTPSSNSRNLAWIKHRN